MLPFKSLLIMSLVGVACSLPATSLHAQEQKLDRSAAIQGAEIFRTYCASCHGREAKGDGPLAKDLKVPPANLTELNERHGGEFPYEMVVDTIEHGRSVRGHGTQDMPAWGDAFKMTSQSETEVQAKIRQLAHYLWSVQVGDP